MRNKLVEDVLSENMFYFMIKRFLRDKGEEF